MEPATVTLSDQFHAYSTMYIHSPMLRARSIVSFTDHLPNSRVSSSFLFAAIGSASLRFSKSSKPAPLFPKLATDEDEDAAFLASARFRAMTSLILSGILGISGSSSTGGGLRIVLDGDLGTDFVLTRGEDAPAAGLDGEGARKREGGASAVFAVERGCG
jgi:hypothetical protein